MDVTIKVPEYTPSSGIKFNWEDGFEIKIGMENGSIVIVANEAGLRSLANHLLNLAQLSVPVGSHIHLDAHNSLEEGSVELVISKE